MFQSLTERLSNAFKSFKNKGKLTEADVREGMREIKLALLEADVNYKVVKDFVKNVTEKATGADVLEALSPAQMTEGRQACFTGFVKGKPALQGAFVSHTLLLLRRIGLLELLTG